MILEIKNIYLRFKKSFFEWIESDNFGIFFIILFFSIFSISIIVRLYNLQIIKGDQYRNKVVRYSEKKINNKTFDRGLIYFKSDDDSDIPVAIQKNGYTLAVDNIHNSFIKNNNPEEVYKKINSIVKINKKDFLLKVKKKKSYRELINKVSSEDIKKIKKLKIKGIYYVKESWREYPLGKTGGKIIGFLDINKNGVNGLEKYYNNILFRKEIKSKNIFLDIFSKNTNDYFSKNKVVRKGDLYTTIDINIQNFLENKLKDISKRYNSKNSLGIIIKPSTGEIIAMADDKNFNFNEGKKDYRNEMVEFRYEPGSIIKPLIVAMGLDSKSIKNNFSYNDRGCIKVQDYNVCNYDKRARGSNVNLIEIIKQSLNLGMVEIQRRIKKSTFLDYFLKFGLSEESGIDLPGEVSPNISSLDYNININYATAAFGQGISSSPISMIRALSIIANDGFLVTPHIVKEIKYNNNIPSKIFDFKKKKVLGIEAEENIKNIMIKAVDGAKSKQKYQRYGYSVAAKTGTAQVASKNGGYKKNANIHAFFGFFPAKAKAEDRYAIILYTFEPREKYSSQTLTKPFYDILDYLISYYDIKPDRLK